MRSQHFVQSFGNSLCQARTLRTICAYSDSDGMAARPASSSLSTSDVKNASAYSAPTNCPACTPSPKFMRRPKTLPRRIASCGQPGEIRPA